LSGDAQVGRHRGADSRDGARLHAGGEGVGVAGHRAPERRHALGHRHLDRDALERRVRSQRAADLHRQRTIGDGHHGVVDAWIDAHVVAHAPHALHLPGVLLGSGACLRASHDAEQVDVASAGIDVDGVDRGSVRACRKKMQACGHFCDARSGRRRDAAVQKLP
jgi:hypothetical protein